MTPAVAHMECAGDLRGQHVARYNVSEILCRTKRNRIKVQQRAEVDRGRVAVARQRHLTDAHTTSDGFDLRLHPSGYLGSGSSPPFAGVRTALALSGGQVLASGATATLSLATFDPWSLTALTSTLTERISTVSDRWRATAASVASTLFGLGAPMQSARDDVAKEARLARLRPAQLSAAALASPPPDPVPKFPRLRRALHGPAVVTQGTIIGAAIFSQGKIVADRIAAASMDAWPTEPVLAQMFDITHPVWRSLLGLGQGLGIGAMALSFSTWIFHKAFHNRAKDWMHFWPAMRNAGLGLLFGVVRPLMASGADFSSLDYSLLGVTSAAYGISTGLVLEWVRSFRTKPWAGREVTFDDWTTPDVGTPTYFAREWKTVSERWPRMVRWVEQRLGTVPRPRVIAAAYAAWMLGSVAAAGLFSSRYIENTDPWASMTQAAERRLHPIAMLELLAMHSLDPNGFAFAMTDTGVSLATEIATAEFNDVWNGKSVSVKTALAKLLTVAHGEIAADAAFHEAPFVSFDWPATERLSHKTLAAVVRTVIDGDLLTPDDAMQLLHVCQLFGRLDAIGAQHTAQWLSVLISEWALEKASNPPNIAIRRGLRALGIQRLGPKSLTRVQLEQLFEQIDIGAHDTEALYSFGR